MILQFANTIWIPSWELEIIFHHVGAKQSQARIINIVVPFKVQVQQINTLGEIPPSHSLCVWPFINPRCNVDQLPPAFFFIMRNSVYIILLESTQQEFNLSSSIHLYRINCCCTCTLQYSWQAEITFGLSRAVVELARHRVHVASVTSVGSP